ncbi:MAG: NAD(P)/FAD-dependent oxidoreductase [Planctomycetota bacterium]
MNCDICIIGAGPAGLMAAISAARAGAGTILLESNTTAGRKLLKTGRGRCNLTHAGKSADVLKAYSPFTRFLRHSIYELSPEALREYFHDHNLATKVEKDGCVFPVTDRATDVLRILLDDARRAGVRFLYGRKAQSIDKPDGLFAIRTATDNIFAPAVVIATGGVSWPHTGSTGDGYRFAEFFGHTIVAPKPALVPLATEQTCLHQLAGVELSNVVISAVVENVKVSASGPMIFTHEGIGGPAVYDFSREITDFLSQTKQPLEIRIDMAPEYQKDQLDKHIIELCQQNPRKELAGIMARLMPRALALDICGRLNSDGQILASQLPKTKRRELIDMIKQSGLTVIKTRPIEEATITRGGVSVEQIDPRTMQSRVCPGLFFAGEVIDVDGPCGGYNLQIAFCTGRVAGREAALLVKPSQRP